MYYFILDNDLFRIWIKTERDKKTIEYFKIPGLQRVSESATDEILGVLWPTRTLWLIFLIIAITVSED